VAPIEAYMELKEALIKSIDTSPFTNMKGLFFEPILNLKGFIEHHVFAYACIIIGFNFYICHRYIQYQSN